MLVLISALLLFGSSAPARAATEAACSHNGARSNGVCKCRHGWTGESCQTLHVGKVDKTKWGYNQLGAPNPAGSWGGGVLQDDAGTWHMWVSENANRCGMNSWGGNSQIVHASSVDVLGPYKRTGVLFDGPFGHEPNMVRAPTGEFVMFYTGNTSPTLVCDCTDDTVNEKGSTKAPAWLECEGQRAGSSDPTYMSWTNTPDDDSSWSSPILIIDPSKYDSIDTNFAPSKIDEDGKLEGLWRTWKDCPEGQDETQCSIIHSVTATNWKDASTYTHNTVDLFAGEYLTTKGIEDPFVWQDEDGIYHALFHYMEQQDGKEYDSTSHAWSTTLSGTWTHTGDAFVQEVTFKDGSSNTFPSCERPHLAFAHTDTAMKPLALITGCNSDSFMRDHFSSITKAGEDWASFTLVQPLIASSGGGSTISLVGNGVSVLVAFLVVFFMVLSAAAVPMA